MKKIILSWMAFLIVIAVALSIPPIPTEYYGTVTAYDVNRTPLPSGTVIDVYANNISCGSFTVVNEGYYGILSCLGDDSYTSVDEGAAYGQSILFYIDSDLALTTGDTVWYYGEDHNVNISPTPACNNGWCELTESCITCAEDCGLCPNNQSGNNSGGSGGNGTGGTGGSGGNGTGGSGSSGGGGGGGGSGSSGGSGGGSGGNVDLGSIGGQTTVDDSLDYCQEDWYCTPWLPDECPIDEMQARACEDKNLCGTDFLKPKLNQTCQYKGTCFDNRKNQDETDVDCGGLLCEPCEDEKECLVDTDCITGYCDPIENICKEPTCNDGYKNQNEEEIDCGGVCPLCERPTLEKPETIVKFISKGCGPFPWLFILLASMFTLGIFGAGKFYIKKTKESSEFIKLRKIDQLLKLYNLNRNLNALILIVILLQIAISLYLYYFCEVGIWILMMILIVIPIAVAVLIKYYVYDEKRKKKKLHDLLIKHEDYLRKLIEIERREIKKEEDKARKQLNELDLKKLDVELAVTLKDIAYIIKQLQESKDDNPYELENSLADTISQLDSHKDKLEGEEMNVLYGDLKLIENIRRSILVHYKQLSEDAEIDKEIEKLRLDREEAGKTEEKVKEEEKVEKKIEKEEKTEKDSIEKIDDSNKEALLKTAKIEQKTETKVVLDAKEEKKEEIKEDPNSLFKIAAKFHKDGMLDDAEKAYKSVLDVDSKNKPALYYLASLYNQQRKSKESMELYEKIIAIDPGYQHAKEYYEKLKH